MITIHALLARCVELGVELLPLPSGNVKMRAIAPVPEELREEIRARKAEVIRALTIPHINDRGELIIPFTADPKYLWWKGGQSIAETLQELNASGDCWRKYIEGYTETKQ